MGFHSSVRSACPLWDIFDRHDAPTTAGLPSTAEDLGGRRNGRLATVLVPEILEPARLQFGLPQGVLSEMRLQRTGVLAVVGELVAAGVPQHVG